MKLATQPCKICGTPVTRSATAFTRGAICSTECRKASLKALFPLRNHNMLDVPCVICGTIVQRFASALAKGKPHCSKKCRAIGAVEVAKRQRNRVELTCKGCGKTFERIPSSLRVEGRGQFCSKVCLLTKPRAAKKPPLKIDVACSICGSTVSRSKYTVKPGRSICCSKKCNAEFAKERMMAKPTPIKPCATCGKYVNIKGRKRDADRVYCSRECSNSMLRAERSTGRTVVIVPCTQCGRDVERSPYRLAVLGHKPFCSRKCIGEMHSIRQSKRVADGRLFSGRQSGGRWKIFINGRERSLKSSYERIYAEHLIEHGVRFEYEPKAFKLSDGMRYTPDFYLNDSDEWIEVKGYMSDRAREKTLLFPKVTGEKLTVLYKDDLERIIGRDINKWIAELNNAA